MEGFTPVYRQSVTGTQNRTSSLDINQDRGSEIWIKTSVRLGDELVPVSGSLVEVQLWAPRTQIPDSQEPTQFPTEEANPVVVTQPMSLVLVEADEAVVPVAPVDHVSGLVGPSAIVGFSLEERRTETPMTAGRETCRFRSESEAVLQGRRRVDPEPQESGSPLWPSLKTQITKTKW